MSRAIPRRTVLASLVAAALPGCGGGGGGTPGGPQLPGGPAPGVEGPAWWGFGRDARHTAVSGIASADLATVAWSAPVDEAPQYTSAGALLTHYGSPVVTAHNTVILPVRTAAGGFRVEARSGGNGGLLWSTLTDYRLPPHNWIPGYNLQLTQQGRLYVPGAGGKLLVRDLVDRSDSPAFQPLVFYGAATYQADAAAFDSAVVINTPLAADAQGNVFFGFQVIGSNPAGLVGGVARIGADGQGRWISAATAAADAAVVKPATNSAPALSPDGGTLYVAVNTLPAPGTVQRGHLLALDAATLDVRSRVALVDPLTGTPARISDNGTSSPAVGPDGRVYFGVLEAVFGTHNARGWLLQFDAQLRSAGVPGSFGWDVTPTVLPATMVPGYGGTSTYLLALKYNNYAGAGTGDGLNRLAVLDPSAAQPDAYSAATVMREVLTILAPTEDPGHPGGRKEWCINTMAGDPARRSVLANNEDGMLYRWDLASNTLVQPLRLTDGLGQAYTPTLVGADGTVYAIANARLFAVRGA